MFGSRYCIQLTRFNDWNKANSSNWQMNALVIGKFKFEQYMILLKSSISESIFKHFQANRFHLKAFNPFGSLKSEFLCGQSLRQDFARSEFNIFKLKNFKENCTFV